jgi:hypothetical protein
MNPRLRHVRVILTAGVLESFDEDLSKRVDADAKLNKPFEATALVAAVKPLAEAATAARQSQGPGAGHRGPVAPAPVLPFVAVIDSEQVRAAVTLALDSAMDSMVDEITRRVIATLQTKPVAAAPDVTAPAPNPQAAPIMETVRRVSTLRSRSSSILGLDAGPLAPGPRSPAPE